MLILYLFLIPLLVMAYIVVGAFAVLMAIVRVVAILAYCTAKSIKKSLK